MEGLFAALLVVNTALLGFIVYTLYKPPGQMPAPKYKRGPNGRWQYEQDGNIFEYNPRNRDWERVRPE